MNLISFTFFNTVLTSLASSFSVGLGVGVVGFVPVSFGGVVFFGSDLYGGRTKYLTPPGPSE